MYKMRLLRLVRGLTQIDLAQQSGVSASKISLLESGRIAPSEVDLERLAHVLEAPVEALLMKVAPAEAGDE